MLICNETCYPLKTKRSHEECQQEQLGNMVADEFHVDKTVTNPGRVKLFIYIALV